MKQQDVHDSSNSERVVPRLYLAICVFPRFGCNCCTAKVVPGISSTGREGSLSREPRSSVPRTPAIGGVPSAAIVAQMRLTALALAALALAPPVPAVSGSPRCCQPTPVPAFATVKTGGLGQRGVARSRGTCGLRMQAQSAVEDPPRFSDPQLALTALSGVITRAERAAMMQTRRDPGTLRMPGSFDDAAGLRKETWEKVAVGQGVRCRKHLDQGCYRETTVQRAVDQVHRCTLEAVAKPWLQQELVFSADEVTELREVARRSYIEGTRSMTKLGQLLAARTMESGYACHSMVTAESGLDMEEFRLVQEVSLDRLLADAGSLDLAKQQLDGMLVRSEGGAKAACILDHGLDFEAETANKLGVVKVLAHARPESELWRFISDSVFDVTYAEEVEDDRQHDSMFEIKVLVESASHAEALHRDLRSNLKRVFSFKDGELRALKVEVSDDSRHVELVSQSKAQRKSKVVWQGVPISVQLQTLDEFYVESELSSRMARGRKDAWRERACLEIERRVSLFKFSRDLLHWLFASSSLRHPPSSERILVKLRQ